MKNKINDNTTLISTVYKCNRCGKEFTYKPFSIQHSNLLSGNNLNCSIKKGELIKDFENSNIQERNCAYIWLEENDFAEELKVMKEHFKDE